MSQILWMRYLLEAQGFKVLNNIVYQDNQIYMKLEKHGQESSGQRTQHINIRYLFVTDCIWAKETKVEYFPMKMMVADLYTKKLHGKIFRLFQNMILNLNDEDVHNIICAEKLTIMQNHNTSDDRDKNDQPLQECVDKSVRVRNNDDKCR